MRKLLVSDLDGTILPRTAHEIPTAVQNAIEKCVQNGADFCVCSGRSYADLKHFFRHFSVPVYYIGCDGALWFIIIPFCIPGLSSRRSRRT